MHDVTPANAPSPTVPDAPSTTIPDAPSTTIPDAQSSAEGFDNILISTELQELNKDGSVSWIKPSDMSDGVVSRIDCDGALYGKEDKGCLAGYSCVVRIVKNGKLTVLVAIAGGARPDSSLVHEMQGVRCGYRQALDRNLHQVELSCDCIETILHIAKGLARERVVGKNSRRSKRMTAIINNIISLQGQIKYSRMFDMRRGANEVANQIAHFITKPNDEVPFKQADFDKEGNQLPEKLQIAKEYLVHDAKGTKYFP
ncbi:uncharacterized protein LOC113332018 isoform X1 [Papaver somniferum]|uniref:uncharacterized protein LOC113332018 isoform X1 n=1 Tax=Papaver somniferum TaxID=3469 RepID=UPI000E6F8E85|nr:uncharacterized protein LOC113332018 isoform X1 [Papaver somniferum]XP_026434460.1 uncharacterized protein LOC113332018 isoform X1 [Papaver somniferum]XP_026434461.1 uncharacterized protein LOC113332018 isoform X1 [Papaver somniferum]XP_026434462.1 uncharacterized protein LOC113332018 isoform X1 [Papaver somniferum]XP_026434463.1 uncharacterized protein LOC113332018 isoform X1 [Papaver somniferum]